MQNQITKEVECGSMNYKRVQDIKDFVQMIELQNKNLPAKLSDTEKKDGFLSVEFSVKDFQEMDNNGCVIGCFDNDYLCGYIVTSSIEQNKKFPLVASMIDCFPKILYKEKPLTNYNSVIPGPVCIDRIYRGKGILANLINATHKFLQEKSSPPELLITFISSENPRSVNAHIKAGMEVVSNFEFNNKNFLILVMSL